MHVCQPLPKTSGHCNILGHNSLLYSGNVAKGMPKFYFGRQSAPFIIIILLVWWSLWVCLAVSSNQICNVSPLK